MKTIGVKLSIKDDKIVDMIARKKGKSKAEMYRKIIKAYFEVYPLNEAEKEIVENMM